MAYVRTFACARVYVCVGPGETIMEKDETSKMKSTEEGQWVPLVEEVSTDQILCTLCGTFT